MSNDLSRRSFLAGAGLVTAGAAAALAAGCSSAPEAPAPAAGEGTGLSPVDPDAVAATEECDIVVVGSGSAGTYAAVRAAERGARVVWLEKNASRGGTSAVTEGLCAPNTQAQLATGGETDLQAFYESEMSWHNWGCVSDVVWAYLNNAGKAIDWALEQGALLTYVGEPEAPMYICMGENGWVNMGTGMLSPLWDYGDTLPNLDLRLKTPAVGLVMEGEKVAGVYAKSPDGSITQINAKAVVIGTGGWGRNPAMVADRLPVPPDRVVFCGMDGQDGDGINMAIDAGACEHSRSAVMYGLSKVVGDPWDGITTVFTQWPPSFWLDTDGILPPGKCLPMVNHEGRRFYNETLAEECNTSRLNVCIASQPKVWTLFDQDHVDTYSVISDFNYGTGTAAGNFAESIAKSPSVVKADTIEELAKAMGVPPETLSETIESYNARILGEDDSHDPFGADPGYQTPLLTPPFYAAAIESNVYGSCGGIRTDGKMNAVHADGTPVEGLYIGGQDNGSFWYNDYPYGEHGGTGQAFCCTSGFVAAESACDALGI